MFINEALVIFFEVFKAVLVIFIVAFFSGWLVRKKIISDQDIKSLSHVTVIVLLPALIFSKIVTVFKPSEFLLWWVLPLLALLMIGVAMLISSAMFFKNWNNKKRYVVIASFMNANYMVLPIGKMVFAHQFDVFITYCFLFVLGVNPSLWTVGKYLVTNEQKSEVSYKSLLTPPFVASISAVLLVLTGINNFIPSIAMQPVAFIGEAAIPVATFILGATLGSIAIRELPPWRDVVKVVSTKLFILPALTIFFLHVFNIEKVNPLLADLLVIQASVAPATQIIIQVKKYGGNVQLTGSMMLICYSICIFTIPIWFTVWKFLVH